MTKNTYQYIYNAYHRGVVRVSSVTVSLRMALSMKNYPFAENEYINGSHIQGIQKK